MPARFSLPVLSFVLLFLTGQLFAGTDDPLDKKEFNTSLSETRNGVVQKKVLADILTFKQGKLQSKLLREKYGFRYIRYRINHDTSYTDNTGTIVRELDLEASATDENNLTVEIHLRTVEWDIDGVIRITRNDKLRRYYDLAGRVKQGKPKKDKKKSGQKIIELKNEAV